MHQSVSKLTACKMRMKPRGSLRALKCISMLNLKYKQKPIETSVRYLMHSDYVSLSRMRNIFLMV